MNMMRAFTLLLLFTAGCVHAQDLTGVWQGHFRSGTMATHSALFDNRYKFEVQIAQHEKSFEAVTYSYLSSIFYGKAAAAGTVNPTNSKVILQEGKLLEVRNQSGDVCTMTCFLQYSRSGDDEFLEGSFVSMNIRDSSNCGRGTIFLHKVNASDFYKEPFLARREKELEKKDKDKEAPDKTAIIPRRTDSPVARITKPLKKIAPPAAAAKPVLPARPSTTASSPQPASPLPGTTAGTTPRPAAIKKPTNPPAAIKTPAPVPMAKFSTPQASQSLTKSDTSSSGIGNKFPLITPRVLQSRSNEVVKTIIIHTNEVTLNIYDDGAIDHDTVSVYVDKKQVINHAMLTDRPIVLTLHLDESDDYHELVMVAENEGEIPPNTSLMIVKTGDQEYEVRITSTEQKNAVVIFKFEKIK